LPRRSQPATNALHPSSGTAAEPGRTWKHGFGSAVVADDWAGTWARAGGGPRHPRGSNAPREGRGCPPKRDGGLSSPIVPNCFPHRRAPGGDGPLVPRRPHARGAASACPALGRRIRKPRRVTKPSMDRRHLRGTGERDGARFREAGGSAFTGQRHSVSSHRPARIAVLEARGARALTAAPARRRPATAPARPTGERPGGPCTSASFSSSGWARDLAPPLPADWLLGRRIPDVAWRCRRRVWSYRRFPAIRHVRTWAGDDLPRAPTRSGSHLT